MAMETTSPALAMANAKLPGFALEAALERLGGNAALLADLLRRFAVEHGAAGAEVDALLDAGRPAHAVAALHRLRGAARVVGAVDVADAAQAAENGLLNGDRAATENFRRALAEAIAVIDAWSSGKIPP
jgi:HPt (histidine-containing phosphotransfer) domain-containing protein